ncbi:MAG: DUF434 domain-containing protein [Isosphaeraceae bacterium]
MPDRRSHRGADPRDAEAFGVSSRPALRSAVRDLSWLLNRGYAPVSSLKLVGDRWGLTERQRMAVRRSACADDDRDRRAAARVERADLAGRILWIDGFNVLTTVESHLGGGVVLRCRDGTFRDLAGVHGTYRRVVETSPALRAIGERLGELGVAEVRWLFDRPVSNSGRIAGLIRELAAEQGLAWSVELVNNPDRVLADSGDVVATADSVILDAGPRWFNLARDVIESLGDVERVVDVSGD